MKYAVIAVINGNFTIHSEHDDVNAAIMEYHSYARALRADQDTTVYKIEVVDENLDVYQGFSEFLDKSPEPEE